VLAVLAKGQLVSTLRRRLLLHRHRKTRDLEGRILHLRMSAALRTSTSRRVRWLLHLRGKLKGKAVEGLLGVVVVCHSVARRSPTGGVDVSS
jgi:hypothetical protein